MKWNAKFCYYFQSIMREKFLTYKSFTLFTHFFQDPMPKLNQGSTADGKNHAGGNLPSIHENLWPLLPVTKSAQQFSQSSAEAAYRGGYEV
jgi:hypothetical protein